jgi:hypothetical protein
MKLTTAVTLTVVLGSVSAQAMDGNSLWQKCLPVDSQGFCLGYVRGVAETLMPLVRICIPGNVTIGQLRDVALKYLQEHPEQRHKHATSLLLSAFNGAWPCAPQKEKPAKPTKPAQLIRSRLSESVETNPRSVEQLRRRRA